MTKIKTLADLVKLRDELQSKQALADSADNAESIIQIKVGMGTSGIASGAKAVIDFLVEALEKRNIEANVSQTGDMGYSYAEPTIEVKKPGKDPVVFGFVNVQKADEIIEKYIKRDELVEGIIPVNYHTIDN
ncbi:MAG: NADP oxidoreductase [Bacteroidetes bacterium GWF2_33_16]|nr:MAG: NADP oxidoreductase [Bacteroidetes bacterium GWE2_32_14]OFY06545.1 MAG: NADP oxidoreductase [Bacteroidetes bacterium GWF2_33_16]